MNLHNSHSYFPFLIGCGLFFVGNSLLVGYFTMNCELAAGFRTLAGMSASARLRIPPAKVFEFADGGVFEHENTGRQEARKSLAVF